ncbi:immunoglobulin binding protein Tap42 isoform X2 [Arctopsyche grandis]|uniref:immunoglobulin binding protein Tap42 isoform X2 n=1 Tax=Arctopsyche grandis TaxID=121162 RepID=UPI00406D7EFB
MAETADNSTVKTEPSEEFEPSEPSEVSEEKLSDIFDKALANYNQLLSKRSTCNDAELEPEVRKCMEQFELATRLVSSAGVFSSNETLDDLTTESMKYLLLPAFLGHLALRIITGSRFEIVTISDVYFRDFIRRCKEYELTDIKVPGPNEDSKTNSSLEAQLSSMMSCRDEKIKRFNMQKELGEKLCVLEATTKSENVDESSKREYYFTLIKLNIILAIDELKFIKSELPLIEMTKNMAKKEPVRKPKNPPVPLRPYIITKNETQKAVFGLGYPSLPIYTVDEFYEQRAKEGTLPTPNSSGISTKHHRDTSTMKNEPESDEEDSKEKPLDEDDAIALQKARDMDEFRDDHKRGEGNRHNRS